MLSWGKIGIEVSDQFLLIQRLSYTVRYWPVGVSQEKKGQVIEQNDQICVLKEKLGGESEKGTGADSSHSFTWERLKKNKNKTKQTNNPPPPKKKKQQKTPSNNTQTHVHTKRMGGPLPLFHGSLEGIHWQNVRRSIYDPPPTPPTHTIQWLVSQSDSQITHAILTDSVNPARQKESGDGLPCLAHSYR